MSIDLNSYGQAEEVGRLVLDGLAKVSNREFLETLAPVLPEGSCVPVASNNDLTDWTSKPWVPGQELVLREGWNGYFCLGSHRRGNPQARTKDSAHALLVVMCDDIGSKVPRDQIRLEPTYEIETSPGNSQFGFLLTEPLYDMDLADRIGRAVTRAKLSDPGAGGLPTRYARLPQGWNSKHNPPFRCRLRAFNPERTYTAQELVDGLGLELDPPKTERKPAENVKRPIPSEIDPYVRKAVEDECEAVASAPVGQRNAQLNQSSFSLGRYVGGGEISKEEVVQRLQQAAATCGLNESEADKTIASGLSAGMQEPRQAPGESGWNREAGQRAVKSEAPTATSVVTTCAADIEMEAISWLWALWIACGKLHILAGEAGTGKTTIALWLASILSCGGRWPDGSRSEVGNVLIWSGEDDPKDTIVPRLRAAGADPSRVHIISGVQAGQDVRAFDPAKDMEGLLDAAQRIGNVKMLILDPIVNAVSGDSHKNTEVRRGLQPVVDFGTRTGCAILGITHFSKGSVGRSPLERLVGSLAFGALARVVMVAATRENQEDGQTARVFMRAKSNIGPDNGGYGYDLEQTPIIERPEISASRVVWGQAIDGKARDVLNQAEAVKDSEGSAISEARAFLREALSEGQKTASEVEAEAKEYGIQFRTVRRAKDGMVIVRKGTKEEGGKWFWSLSDQDDQVRCPTKKQGHLGYLGHVTSQDDQLDQDDQEILSGKLGHVTSTQIVEVVI